MNILVGCIDKMKVMGDIETRFFFADTINHEIKDVTLELCDSIDEFNEVAEMEKHDGSYSMTIPYEYKYGLAVYSHGCGLTHYLQECYFKTIVERYSKKLSFDLESCCISMFTPGDLKQILNSSGAFDKDLIQKLRKHYF